MVLGRTWALQDPTLDSCRIRIGPGAFGYVINGSSTTWMQQLCHQLRTQGKGTDFKEITEVMPWIDFAWEIDQGTYCLTAIHSS